MISNRFAEANNKYLPDFDPDEHSNYIMYLDLNNLYGKSKIADHILPNFNYCINNV